MDYFRRNNLQGLPQMGSRGVMVTGLGAVSAAGVGYPALWDSLLHARSGIGLITRFDTTDMESRIAGEVRNFDPQRLIEPRLKPRKMSRQAQFAVVAAMEAAKDAGLDRQQLGDLRVGVVIGSATGSMEIISQSAIRIQEKGVRRADPNLIHQCNPQASALAVSDLLELEEAFAMSVSNACIAGLDAIKIGCEMIRANRFDMVVCGGTDAPISKTPWAEFTVAGLNNTRNDEPQRAVRPFDRERETGLLGEGSGIIVLESARSAQERGARCYMEIAGEHACVDPVKERPCCGMAQTMVGAMRNATCPPNEVDFISAWGPGHSLLDRIETEAIKEVFGQRAYDIPVCSIKGVIGSPLGAAGAIQTVAVALSFQHKILPPTTNWEHRDLDCDLDYIPNRPRRATLRHVLLNAHGVGGSNTSVLFRAAA